MQVSVHPNSNETGRNMEEAQRETELAEKELSDYFDIKRFDTNFMSELLVLFKPKPAPAPQKQTTQTSAQMLSLIHI